MLEGGKKKLITHDKQAEAELQAYHGLRSALAVILFARSVRWVMLMLHCGHLVWAFNELNHFPRQAAWNTWFAGDPVDGVSSNDLDQGRRSTVVGRTCGGRCDSGCESGF